jgi:hypothetical protein
MMRKFWAWYNRLQEPWRFSIAALLLVPPMFAIAWGDMLWQAAGCVWLALFLVSKTYDGRV